MASGYTAMIAEADIWCSAAQIIKRYGEDAPLEAAMRADAMLDAGDLDGLAVWKRIKKAAEEHGAAEPDPEVSVGK